MNIETIASILASEIECEVYEKYVIPALNTARKVLEQPAQDEPVAWRWENNGADKWLNKFTYLDNGAPDCPEDCEPLYTRPQAHEWVWLTAEQIAELDYHDHYKFARAIEAKLKEKNS